MRGAVMGRLLCARSLRRTRLLLGSTGLRGVVMGLWIWGQHWGESVGLWGRPDAVFDMPELRSTVGMEENERDDGDEEQSNDEDEADDDDHVIDDGDEGDRKIAVRAARQHSASKAIPSTTLHHTVLVPPGAMLALLSFTTPCTCPQLLRTTPQVESRASPCRYRVTAGHLPTTPILGNLDNRISICM